MQYQYNSWHSGSGRCCLGAAALAGYSESYLDCKLHPTLSRPATRTRCDFWYILPAPVCRTQSTDNITLQDPASRNAVNNELEDLMVISCSSSLQHSPELAGRSESELNANFTGTDWNLMLAKAHSLVPRCSAVDMAHWSM